MTPPRLHSAPLCQILAALIVLASISAGCRKSTPPGADRLSGAVKGSYYSLLHWKEGLRVLLIDNVTGSHAHSGSGSTSGPIYRESGEIASQEGLAYRYELETPDGKKAKFSIAGKPYDLTSGQVFLIAVNGEELAVKQLAHDLSKLDPTRESCEKFIQADLEIAEYLSRSSK